MRLSKVLVVLLTVCFIVPAFAQAPSAPATKCDTPEHHQFDFWVGRWDVYPTGKDTLVAHSLIEKLYGGCAIRENWMPIRGGSGGSLNSWRPAERRWRQTWADSDNEYTEFSGGIEGDAMVLTGPASAPDGKPELDRMRFTRGSDGSVRQLGTMSTDGGANWQPRYDFTYRPAH